MNNCVPKPYCAVKASSLWTQHMDGVTAKGNGNTMVNDMDSIADGCRFKSEEDSCSRGSTILLQYRICANICESAKFTDFYSKCHSWFMEAGGSQTICQHFTGGD